MDADSRVSQRLARETVTLMTSEHVAGGGAVIAMETQNRMAVFLVGLWNRLSRLTQTAAGSYLFCRTADFKAVGGFSEDLYASAELNLTKKIKKLTKSRGQSFRIIPSSPIHTSARKFGLTENRTTSFFIEDYSAPSKCPETKTPVLSGMTEDVSPQPYETTFCGLPARKPFRFSTAMTPKFSGLNVAHAMWGVR